MSDRFQNLRLLEALLFASPEPLGRDQLARHLPEDADFEGLIEELRGIYENRGVVLFQAGDRWAFRTAPDLAGMMQIEREVARKLTRAALETLAIIAYHQPVTRGEIEEVRGVALSKGTLDTLLEAGWIKPRGRRRTPGRPVTWGTTPDFLDQFGLESLEALPRVAELKAAGLLDKRPALTALTDRGKLGALMDDESDPDGKAEAEAEEEPAEGEPWDILAAEFEEDQPAAEPAKQG